MPVSKITYKQNIGFWVEETFMQLMYHYIHEQLVKPQYLVKDKHILLKSIRDRINGYFIGSMSLGWRNFIETNSEIQTMTQVLENTKMTLNSKGEYISVGELQNISTEDVEFKLYFSNPFPTSDLIEILNALIQMLNGSWTSTDYNMQIDFI